MTQPVSRRRFAAVTAATFESIGIASSPARAAQFQFRYGNDQSTSSPVPIRSAGHPADRHAQRHEYAKLQRHDFALLTASLSEKLHGVGMSTAATFRCSKRA
jgi:hypothetical protein